MVARGAAIPGIEGEVVLGGWCCFLWWGLVCVGHFLFFCFFVSFLFWTRFFLFLFLWIVGCGFCWKIKSPGSVIPWFGVDVLLF